MITVILPGTGGIETQKEAEKFLRDHALIKKTDLRKVAALARKHGILKELKALGIDVRELKPRRGEGAWDE
jgi:hypothetical protein